MRRKVLSLALCLCMAISLLPMPMADAAFTDVNPSDWFFDNVQYVTERGLMGGVTDSIFSPYRTTTRGMIVTILHRLDGTPAASGASFSDLRPNAYYSDAVPWAENCGIVNGYADGTFRPDQELTRQQMAAILYRYATYKNYDVTGRADLSVYADSTAISNYARDAMAWANAAGIINGTSDKHLNPGGSATRAHMAAILTRFCENYVPETNDDDVDDATPVSYTVSFDLNYTGGGVYQTQTVLSGEMIQVPVVPTRTGYRFIGWYDAASGGKEFNFSTVIDSSLTLFARWNLISSSSSRSSSSRSSGGNTVTTYSVSFSLNYAGAVANPAAQSVISGQYAQAPVEPVRDGYLFTGWYDAAEKGNLFPFYSQAIQHNTTLYAHWMDVSGGDTDGDNLLDSVEEYYGTDPTKTDTDGDGLSDYFELMLTGTNPLLEDSDMNGVKDGDEDPDGDSLTNLQEQEYGCEPLTPDTDADGLTDGEEVVTYTTSPNQFDTDGDGLGDGDEVTLDLDPLKASSDGITPDGDRVFEQTLSEDSIAVELLSEENDLRPGLEGTTAGNIDSTTRLSGVSNPELNSNKSVVGTPVDLITTMDIADNNVTLFFETGDRDSQLASLMSDENEIDSLLICKYDENGGFSALETNHDAENQQISANVTESGIYFVLNTETFLLNLDIDVTASEESGDTGDGGAETVNLASIQEVRHTERDYSNDRVTSSVTPPAPLESVSSEAEHSSYINAEYEEDTAALFDVGDTRAQADIVFVIDATGSMSEAISNVAENVNQFAEKLINNYHVNANFSVVEFQDITWDGLDSTIQHRNGSSSWWNARNVSSFMEMVNSIEAKDGGDGPETDIDGLAMARALIRNSSTQKFLILITDAPYKLDNQYGIQDMNEMIDMLEEDGISVSVITQDWDFDEWTLREAITQVGYYESADDYVHYVYQDKATGEYFYFDDDDIHNNRIALTGPELDRVDFRKNVGYIILEEEEFYAYLDVRTGEYFYNVYDSETSTSNKVVIENPDDIVRRSNEGVVTGYKELYERTGGVFGDIYEDFAVILEELAAKIDKDANTGSWIVLDSYEPVQLKAPLASGSSTDTDGDGIPDCNEITGAKTINLLPVIRNELRRRGLPEEEYKGVKEITVYSYRSHPAKVDTDDDGLLDGEDTHPREWDVCDRDLAMFAALSENPDNYRKKRVNDTALFTNFAHADELYSSWNIMDDRTFFAGFLGERYKAVTFKSGKNLVISFSASNSPLDEWFTGLTGFWSVLYGGLESEARNYAHDVVRHNTDCNIYITGHSMGGYLAQSAAAEVIKDYPDVNVVRVVSFNGMGFTYNLAERSLFFSLPDATKSVDRDVLQKYYQASSKNLIAYFVNGDMTDDLGEHLGSVQRFDAADDVLAANRGKYGSGGWTTFPESLLNSLKGTVPVRKYFDQYKADSYKEYVYDTHTMNSFFRYLSQGTRVA